MRWIFYNFFFSLAYLFMAPRFLLRMRKRGGYREKFGQRFGRYSPEDRQELDALHAEGVAPVWIHAVSVGEVFVAGQMMRAMRAKDPSVRFVLSTTSSTGWKQAEEQITGRDARIYCPLDLPGAVRSALDAVRPRAFLLTESELWPNLIRAAAKRGVPLFLVNARVSDRSAPGYRRLRIWFGPALRAFRLIQAQSGLDRDRLLAAGARPDTVEVAGSFKFDVANRAPAKEAAAAAILSRLGLAGEGLTLLLGGSTWPGEEEILLAIYRKLSPAHPGLRLALVPRHFERGAEVEAAIHDAGFACVRKSRLDAGDDPEATGPEAVLLVDTTGEMMGFYGNAHIVFVGKSLMEHGAQNMIEPCLCGAATIVGPNTENFRPVMADLLAAKAILQVPDSDALRQTVETLLARPGERKALGERARAAVLSRKGVVDRCAAQILDILRDDAGRKDAPCHASP
jgi:3-deoxy-D-manno-octulosonic-acid transferase